MTPRIKAVLKAKGVETISSKVDLIKWPDRGTGQWSPDHHMMDNPNYWATARPYWLWASMECVRHEQGHKSSI